MNKTIILDDRPERKKSHISDSVIKQLEECTSLSIVTGESINSDNIEVSFDRYSLLAIHKSWLDNKGLTNKIVDYCKRNRKYLIIFSGGIGQSLLLDNYMRLNVNSASFYTDRLPLFIEKYASNNATAPLLEFLYGEGWRLPILMECRNYLWHGVYDDKYESEEAIINHLNSIFHKQSDRYSISDMNNMIYNEILKTKSV